MRRTPSIAAALMLAACAAQPGTEIVTEVQTQVIAIPAGLVAPVEHPAPLADGATWRDALARTARLDAALAVCNGRLVAAGALLEELGARR